MSMTPEPHSVPQTHSDPEVPAASAAAEKQIEQTGAASTAQPSPVLPPAQQPAADRPHSPEAQPAASQPLAQPQASVQPGSASAIQREGQNAASDSVAPQQPVQSPSQAAQPGAAAQQQTQRFAPPGQAVQQNIPPQTAAPQGWQPQQPGATQPTVPLTHAEPGNGVGASEARYGAPPTSQYGVQPDQSAQPAPTAKKTKSQPRNRTGALLAGLAIGALLGGVAGGGVAAVVASNLGSGSVTQNGGTLTLANSETATAISGVAAVATPSVVTLEVATATAAGSGSGVIYSEDGYIITNAHVVTLDGAASDAQVSVKLSDGRIYAAEIVGTDPYADLAVVKVEAEGLPAIGIADSSKINVGDLTVAIGAPMNLANTVTSGVVSAINRGISVGSPLIPEDPQEDAQSPENEEGSPWDYRFDNPESGEEQQQSTGGTVTLPVIQTDASINPGNSGGALLDGNGELIGINVAIASPTSSDGVAGSDGLGFAIPSNLVERVVEAIIAGEQPSHGLLGASVGDATQASGQQVSRAGGLISGVTSGGAAQKAGLKSGDIITSVNGIAATDGTTVSALVRMNAGGSEVEIRYLRDGEERETTATLGTLEW